MFVGVKIEITGLDKGYQRSRGEKAVLELDTTAAGDAKGCIENGIFALLDIFPLGGVLNVKRYTFWDWFSGTVLFNTLHWICFI